MIKPASLRQALTLAAPTLQRDPDHLLVWINQGALVATPAQTLSFEYRYRLNVILTDYAGEVDPLFVALLNWVKSHQPDLLHPFAAHDNGITFEVDLLNHTSCDVSLALPLTERVIVTTRSDGSHQIEHAQEPENSA